MRRQLTVFEDVLVDVKQLRRSGIFVERGKALFLGYKAIGTLGLIGRLVDGNSSVGATSL